MARLSPHHVTFVTTLIMLIWVIYQTRVTLSYMEEQRDREAREVKLLPWCHYEEESGFYEEERGFRVRFGSASSVTVKGWPSKGGVYVLEDCSGIDLDFLKLDRFHDTPPSSGPDADAEEEAHCNRMRQLGAIWWESTQQRDDRKFDQMYIPSLGDDAFIKVGWPAGGGVWVLNITDDEAITKGAGTIHNAYDMEHRCRLIEQLGGVFYKNPKDWLDLDLP